METIVLNANSVDQDQTPQFAVSNLGLHCLPMSLLWDTRRKLVKTVQRVSRLSILAPKYQQTIMSKIRLQI